MKPSRKILALMSFVAALSWMPAQAGTLDNAPFQLAAPSADWQLDDAFPQRLGGAMILAATLTNEKQHLKSMVVTGPVKLTPTALDELCASLRNSFSNPIVKKLSDEPGTFVGYKAQALAYEVTPVGTAATYNEARIFLVGNTAWVVSVIGPVTQKAAVKQMLTLYRPRR
jgi:hypothetical protein